MKKLVITDNIMLDNIKKYVITNSFIREGEKCAHLSREGAPSLAEVEKTDKIKIFLKKLYLNI